MKLLLLTLALIAPHAYASPEDFTGKTITVKSDLKISSAGNKEGLGYFYGPQATAPAQAGAPDGITLQCYIVKQMPANRTLVIKAGTKFEIGGTISGDGPFTLMLNASSTLNCASNVNANFTPELVNALMPGLLQVQ